jgi:hypothetical protein
MLRNCTITGKHFTIHPFEEEMCKHFNIPLPTTHPQERLREVMAYRNEWKLYPRKCDKTGEKILSAYPQESPFPVYKYSEWWGDSWEGLDYGRDYDFNRPFFEQFAELQKVVPREGTSVFDCENCDYNSHWRTSKNCYMNSLGYENEDIIYSYWIGWCKNISDSMYTYYSELCYNSIEADKCYNCISIQECENCSDCYFSFQLRNCKNCIFSSNLTNKDYYIFNRQASKEEFEETKKKLFDGSWKKWQEANRQFKKLKQDSIHRAVHNNNCENIEGDYLHDSRNCFECYDGSNGNEDCYNCISIGDSKNIQNTYSAGWTGCQYVQQSSVVRGCNNIAFCTYTWNSNDCMYMDSCMSCSDCFGCIGLKHKKFCILNKQYTEEEYKALLPKIIEHMKNDGGEAVNPTADLPCTGAERLGHGRRSGSWGKFFPPWLNPFAYNESAAQEQAPLAREEALKRGYRWNKKNETNYKPATYQLTDNISDTPNTITDKILACTDCSRNYKIIPQELKIYRQWNLPIPRKCSYCRHSYRMSLRNPRQLWKRQCDKCQKEVESTYSPERPETVYCEECYLNSLK